MANAMSVDQRPSAIFYVCILILIAVLCFIAVRAMRRASSNSDGRWATLIGAVLGCIVGLPVAAFAAAVIVTLIVVGFFLSGGSTDTVACAKSPSRSVEAPLDENNGGGFKYVVNFRAVSSSATTVFRVASAYVAVRNDDLYGMALVRVDANTLEIQYWQEMGNRRAPKCIN
jgi:hypothetical protein